MIICQEGQCRHETTAVLQNGGRRSGDTVNRSVRAAGRKDASRRRRQWATMNLALLDGLFAADG